MYLYWPDCDLGLLSCHIKILMCELTLTRLGHFYWIMVLEKWKLISSYNQINTIFIHSADNCANWKFQNIDKFLISKSAINRYLMWTVSAAQHTVYALNCWWVIYWCIFTSSKFHDFFCCICVQNYTYF